MRRQVESLACVLGWFCASVAVAADRQAIDRRQQQRIEQSQREEGEAILDLADAVLAGRSVPSDFHIAWHNDFLKAQEGTFVPFVVTITASSDAASSALLYVRAVRRNAPLGVPFDAVFPIDVSGAQRGVRVSRGFSLAAGEYDLCIVVRERPPTGASGAAARRPRKAGGLKRTLSVPDFWTGELTMSTPILADRLTVLPSPPGEEALTERPYVIGVNEIQPAADASFRRDEELVVVFLVYNPVVTEGKKFDVQVEYHFFRKIGRAGGRPAARATHPPARAGEEYFNHTEPQRFNAATMGAQFNPAAGDPVMAGQGVPLAEFAEGDYRLAIKVVDLISGKTLLRDVTFTVGG